MSWPFYPHCMSISHVLLCQCLKDELRADRYIFVFFCNMTLMQSVYCASSDSAGLSDVLEQSRVSRRLERAEA